MSLDCPNCAALRQAANIGAKWMRRWLDEDECECFEYAGSGEHFCGKPARQAELREIETALATDAGRKVLDEMRRKDERIRELERLESWLDEFEKETVNLPV